MMSSGLTVQNDLSFSDRLKPFCAFIYIIFMIFIHTTYISQNILIYFHFGE